jgi:hypothetical protein
MANMFNANSRKRFDKSIPSSRATKIPKNKKSPNKSPMFWNSSFRLDYWKT